MISEHDLELLRQLNTTLIANCHKCSGSGFIFSDECECTKKYRIEYERMKAGIPYDFRKLTISYLKDKKVRDAPIVRKFIKEIKSNKENGIGLLVLGPSGTGKAAVASIVLNELINRGCRNCNYLNFSEIIRAIRSIQKLNYTLVRGGDEDIKKTLYNSEFLVINGMSSLNFYKDDYNSSYNEIKGEILSILKTRASLTFPTIITAESPNELAKWFTDKIKPLLKHHYIQAQV